MQLFFGSEGARGEVANIVEVDYPWSDVVRKFCLVEPQTNDVVTCWIDDEMEDDMLPGVTWVDIGNYYPWFPEGIQETGAYYFYVDSDHE
jgi:hypothetical protein